MNTQRSHPIRVVLAGTGGIAEAWTGTRAWRERIEPVGLANRTIKRCQRFAAKHRLDHLPMEDDLARLLTKVQADAVFDCTSSASHPAVTMAALSAGCHVLVEKPMADDLASATSMVELAERKGLVLAVAQTQRMQPEVTRIAHLLASGMIGDIGEWHAELQASANFGDFRDRQEHVLLSDMAIHTCDLARAFGFGPCRSVLAHSWNPRGSWFASGASASAIFTAVDGGVFTFRGTWAATGHTGSWRGSWRIRGSRGTLLWDGGNCISVQVLDPPSQPSLSDGGSLARTFANIEISPPAQGQRTGHDAAIDSFCSAILDGVTPPSTGRDNLGSIELLHAALQAARGNGLHVCRG